MTRHWCSACRSTYTSIADHITATHPHWTLTDVETNVHPVEFTTHAAPDVTLAIRASLLSASRARRVGGLGYRAHRMWR